jgi:ATP-dependent Clp protease ATP-binding subunit ClpC
MEFTSFTIGTTHAYLAVRLKRIYFSPISGVCYVLVIAAFFTEEFIRGIPQTSLFIAAAILVGFLWIVHRLHTHLADHDIPTESSPNLADALSYHMVQHLSTKDGITASTLLEAATESARGLFVLHQMGIEREDILKAWNEHPEHVSIDTCLQWGLKARTELRVPRLDSTAMIYAYFKNVGGLQTLLNTADLSMDDLTAILKAESFHFYLTEKHRHAFSPDAIVRILGAIGKSWVVGYNSELERLTTSISRTALSTACDTVIHEDNVKSILQSFIGGSRKNILLIGKPGCGRRTVARNVAVALRKHELERGVGFTDVLKLQTTEVLSGVARGDTEMLNALKKAVESGSFVVVIEDLALLMEGSDARLKDVLRMLLEAKNLRTIGIMETADYHTHMKNDPALDILFQKIALSDATDEETMHVLLEEYFLMERRRAVRITYKALTSILDLSKRFLGREALPGKAVDILREAVARTRATGETIVTEESIREVVSVQARVDVRQLSENEKMKLLTLEARLKTHIIGQSHALSSITAALKRAKLDLGTRKKPMGTFLFLGTTGVGKTETAKALAQEYFGSSESFIRVDMNEYTDEASISELIGGRTNTGFLEGFLTKKIQDQPFSILLLDEVEKAHTKVLHLFLQILDEGMLLDGNGIQTDFRNTIIIATSNAGGRYFTSHPAPPEEDQKLLYTSEAMEFILNEKVFSPEFINRFDEVIVFEPPSMQDVERIAILMLDDLIKDIAQKRGIRIIIEANVLTEIARRGYNPEFGSRELRRTITQTVETYLADYLLSHEVRRGEEIVIRLDDIRMQ